MRLHHLRITAFGPFAEPTEVDFDELSAAGLFLLTGATGAGKSSVLDAVCFALYGEVPGDRHCAKHLRSDHAATGVAPEAVLEATISGRRFRFRRSPAWERPKKRGTGAVRVQAHAVVEELVADGWSGLTNRLDEAGQLIVDLLGMTCSQFTQVAMLPQGQFQAFLTATSAERHAVLQRLFDTRRFEDAERWLVEHRATARTEDRGWSQRAAALVSRTMEAGTAELPADWELDDLSAQAHPEQSSSPLLDWADGLLSTADEAAALRGQDRAQALERLREAQLAHADASGRAHARARGERAQQALGALESEAADVVELRRRLDRHQLALPVRPHRVRVVTLDRAHAEAAAAIAGLPASLRDLDQRSLAGAMQALAKEQTTAEAFHGHQRELTTLGQRRAVLASELDELADDLRALREQAAALPERLAGAHQAVMRCRTAAARVGEDTRELDTASRGVAAATKAERLAEELTRRRAEHADLRARSLTLRETYLALREERISGMAGELAAGLASGCSCPVCGSHDHPALARATSAVTRAEEDAARKRVEDVEPELQALHEVVVAVETTLAAQRAIAAGHDLAEWQTREAAAQLALARSSGAAQELDGLLDRLKVLTERRGELDRALSRTTAEQATATGEAQRLDARAETLRADLAEVLETRAAASLSALLIDIARDLALHEQAREAQTTLTAAVHELSAATSAAQVAAHEAGFDSPDQAMTALMAEADVEHAQARLVDYDRRLSAARVQLADDEVLEALGAEPVDLAALAAEVAGAAEDHNRAVAAAHTAHQRHSRLGDLRTQLAECLAGWRPVHQRLRVATEVAALAEGKSIDNRWRMRLSGYVLSERLGQVVAAANDRLAAMSSERYLLEQSDERGAGDLRGGLSLLVRDQWTGVRRDPATLSGGETFVVSLALALGLADTVTHEAGGTEIGSLFVDEGFGSLDADTLDDVMNTLDSLRDGGRVVGLVSHVPELRTRVPAQLEVELGRDGSTVRQRLHAG